MIDPSFRDHGSCSRKGLSGRRILIVTSSYAPTMIADMHRARHLAWELPKHGWVVEILSPDNTYQNPSCVDFDSLAFFNPSTKINWVPLVLPRLFNALGVGTIGWRALIPMLLIGSSLLKHKRFDLIYFSTTQFVLFLLGPLWQRWYGIPYALDFHDPALYPHRARPVWMKSTLKYSIGRWISRHVEKMTMTSASAVVSVSPIYLEDFYRRYGRIRPKWWKHGCAAVIPFSVLRRDFESVSPKDLEKRATHAKARIVYVGAGGPIMRRSFSLFCEGLAALRQRQPGLADRVQVELYGTHSGWREGEPRYLAEVAEEHGVEALVREWPGHVSYRRSLELLLHSDGALILGVDDAGYIPSKLYPYAFSKKPLLGVVRSDGPAFAAFQTFPVLGHCLWFDKSGAMPMAQVVGVLRTFVQEVISGQRYSRNNVLQPFLASSMASRHAELFERVVARQGMRISTTPAIGE